MREQQETKMDTPVPRVRPKRVKTTEDVVSGMRRQIRALKAAASADDPWVLAEMLNLAAELDGAALDVVRDLRKNGYRWADIAFDLGISPAAACKRYAHLIDRCSGTGRPWDGETAPVCPVCGRDPSALGKTRPARGPGGRWAGRVPEHQADAA